MFDKQSESIMLSFDEVELIWKEAIHLNLYKLLHPYEHRALISSLC